MSFSRRDQRSLSAAQTQGGYQRRDSVAGFSYTITEGKLTLLKPFRVAFCSQSFSINIQRNRYDRVSSEASREHNGNAIKNVSMQARGWRYQAQSQSGACKSTLSFRGLQAPWLVSQTFPELMVMLKHRNPLIWLK